MTAVKLILDKKREGHALGSAEIREFIEGFCDGEMLPRNDGTRNGRSYGGEDALRCRS